MSFHIKPLTGYAYLAADGFDKHVQTELTRGGAVITARYGDLFFQDDTRKESFWSRCVMENPVEITFDSVSDAVAALRSLQRNWAVYRFDLFRRAELIKSRLPYISEKEKAFPYEIPHAPMGLWCLTGEHTILASTGTSSPLPAGELHFIEDHENPPSRAYLKLQEALTLTRYYFPAAQLPQTGSRCFDAGACPGGWTWVLNNLGCTVIAVDRSPLDDSLMNSPNITFVKHDAFTLLPDEMGVQDWICSDVICYPARLYEWVKKWLESGLCHNFICTIKMQGEPDWETISAFNAIPGSRIVHLTANKHELTFIHAE